jgi:hypothetical protein
MVSIADVADFFGASQVLGVLSPFKAWPNRGSAIANQLHRRAASKIRS